MWYWKQTKYDEYTLYFFAFDRNVSTNKRQGKFKTFNEYSAMFNYCEINSIDAKQI